MWPEMINHLPTKMRALHNWYLKASAEGQMLISALVKDEHYFRGADEIIMFSKSFGICTIKTPSTSLYSAHGSCKCFRSLIWISRLKSIVCTLTRILFLSCRMEIRRCRWNGFFGIGFIDPYTIHGPNIAKYPNRMRNTIAHFFNKQHHKEIILFPYNFG